MGSSLNSDPSWVLVTTRVVEINFYERLWMVTTLPLMMIVWVIYFYAGKENRKRMGQTSREGIENTRKKWISLIVWMVILVYSNTSSVVLQTFDCIALNDEEVYLQADYSTECNRPKHKAVAIYAGLMVVVYALEIPTLFACVLFNSPQRSKTS